MKYTKYVCSGFWHDGERFDNMIVTTDTWDGIEDAEDELISFYVEDEPIIGDHWDFTIETAELWEYANGKPNN